MTEIDIDAHDEMFQLGIGQELNEPHRNFSEKRIKKCKLSLFKVFLFYNVSMTLLLELSNKLNHLDEKEQFLHLKVILSHLTPYDIDSYGLSAGVRVPAIAIMRKYFKDEFNIQVCNYNTAAVATNNSNISAEANINTKKSFQTPYGVVYSFTSFDVEYECDFGYTCCKKDDPLRYIYNNYMDYAHSRHKFNIGDGLELNLPYPPRVCIVNKNNLIGDSLNAEITTQIDKLKQTCADFEELKSVNTHPAALAAETAKRMFRARSISSNININTTIVKQQIIDPLLNTNKYMIPSLFYVNKDEHRCEILSEINNFPRLYNLYMYDLIGLIFFKFISTIEYMLNLNDLNHQIIQVIVSCQNEILKPNTYYVGDLHREGFVDCESIQVGCIYYFDKSICLSTDGEKGKTKSDDILQIVNGYGDPRPGGKFESFKLRISKNDCIVFNNTLMNHKVFKLCNTSNETGHRSLISFWLPKYKINSSHDINVLYKCNINQYKYHFIKIFDIVKHWARKFNQQKKTSRNNIVICKEIENIINQYVVSKKVMKYSNYSCDEVNNVHMNRLQQMRIKLRNKRTDLKMMNEPYVIFMK